MKTFYVDVPVSGQMQIRVEASSEAAAKKKVLNGEGLLMLDTFVLEEIHEPSVWVKPEKKK